MTTLDPNSFSAQEAKPQIEALEPLCLSEQYAPLNRMIGLASTGILAIIASIIYFQPFIPLTNQALTVFLVITGLVLGLSLIITFIQYAADKRKFYALREMDIHYMSGLFFRKVVSQPITRIQHVELKRGPIDRKKGLAKLQVFSAGGEAYTFEIPGLPLQTAQKIRQLILQHKDMLKDG